MAKATRTKQSKPSYQTTVWRVIGPGDVVWSIWDFGDEMTVQDGPELTSNMIGRIPGGVAERLDAGNKRHQMENAAGAIHVARLLGASSPNLRGVWTV